MNPNDTEGQWVACYVLAALRPDFRCEGQGYLDSISSNIAYRYEDDPWCIIDAQQILLSCKDAGSPSTDHDEAMRMLATAERFVEQRTGRSAMDALQDAFNADE